MKWERSTEKFSNGYIGMLGKWPVFRVMWDGCSPRDKNTPHLLTCLLPGIKDRLGHFETDVEAKEKAERVLKYWLNEAGAKLDK